MLSAGLSVATALACLAASTPTSLAPSGCKEAIDRAMTDALLERFSALGGECELRGVFVEGSSATMRWLGPGDQRHELSLRPSSCVSSPALPGRQLSVPRPVGSMAQACPETYRRVEQLLAAERFGGLVDLSPHRPRVGAGTIIFWSVLSLLGVIGLPRWRGRERVVRLLALVPFGPAMLAIAALGAVLWLGAYAPLGAKLIRFSEIDLSRLADATGDVPLGLSGRAVWRLVVDWWAPWGQLSAARWFWLIAAIHLLNSGLIFTLARRLGLPTGWAALAGLVFFSNPGVIVAFSIESMLELWLVTAYLLVVYGYIGRGEARSRTVALGWLAVEVVAVLLGMGNKESFVIYPALLLALEWTLLWPREAHRGYARRVAIRLAPHAALLVWLAPGALNNGARAAGIDWGTLAPLEQLARLVGYNTVPPFDGAFWPGVAVCAGLLVVGIGRTEGPLPRFGVLMAFITVSPMLMFADRVAPGYVYQPWAGVVLAGVGLLARRRSVFVRLGGLCWLMALACNTPATDRLWEGADDVGMMGILEQIPASACATSPPSWRVPPQVWRRLSTVNASRDEAWVADLATNLLRLRCGDPGARAVGP